MAKSQQFTKQVIPTTALQELLAIFNTTVDRWDNEKAVWIKVGQAEVVRAINDLIHSEEDDVS
jgi:hypothetical protein